MPNIPGDGRIIYTINVMLTSNQVKNITLNYHKTKHLRGVFLLVRTRTGSDVIANDTKIPKWTWITIHQYPRSYKKEADWYYAYPGDFLFSSLVEKVIEIIDTLRVISTLHQIQLLIHFKHNKILIHWKYWKPKERHTGLDPLQWVPTHQLCSPS